MTSILGIQSGSRKMLKGIIQALGAQPIKEVIANYNVSKQAMSHAQPIRSEGTPKTQTKALKLDFHA